MRYSEITGELRSTLTEGNNLSDVKEIIERLNLENLCEVKQDEDAAIIAFSFAGESEWTAMNFGFAEWIAGIAELSKNINHSFEGVVEINKPEYRVMRLKVSGIEVHASVVNDPVYPFGNIGEQKDVLVHVSRRFTNLVQTLSEN